MIYTGYWANVDNYKLHNLTPVGISGRAPDGYTGQTYKKLAPKYSWWREWHDKHLSEEWYTQKYYETILDTLDPDKVIYDLQNLGTNVVLLCFETPEKFCHRHIVAKWLNEKTSINVHEYILQSQQLQLGL